jgi:phosphotransferase system enzyme I (PtsI)
VRTELLFHSGMPDEQAQYVVYRRIVEWAEGRPVTIRTLDAGADKPIPGLTLDDERNPSLGVRGLRLSFAFPEVFRTQLRALARAAVHGNVKMMLPMVTSPRELDRARAMLDEEVMRLRSSGTPATRPSLGIMVEVPAAAIAADLFPAEFFSIGSNDLTQYVAAAGRDVNALTDLADPSQPAVLRLIRYVVDVAAARGAEVSLCGDAGADPAMVPRLLGVGLRTLSVAPALVGRTKRAIAGTDLREVKDATVWPK